MIGWPAAAYGARDVLRLRHHGNQRDIGKQRQPAQRRVHVERTDAARGYHEHQLALRAFQEAGRTDSCAIMGQNASPEGRAELRQAGTRLVGSVAYLPEKYGAEIVAVALDILHRRAVPPAVFVKHQLVTPETVNHIYPNDELMMTPGLSA